MDTVRQGATEVHLYGRWAKTSSVLRFTVAHPRTRARTSGNELPFFWSCACIAGKVSEDGGFASSSRARFSATARQRLAAYDVKAAHRVTRRPQSPRRMFVFAPRQPQPERVGP